MSKVLDLSKSVKDICSEYPEAVEILKELGFEQIASPGMLNTVGRFMTLPKGASMRGIDLAVIRDRFEKEGFEIKE